MQNPELECFKGKFKFNPAVAFHVGIERECFLTDPLGNIVPNATSVIKHVEESGWHVDGDLEKSAPGAMLGYELSACQIETRTNPCEIGGVASALRRIDSGLRNALQEIGLRALYSEVAPDDMSLDVYPDPTGRYAEITRTMPREVLLAACQVAGTHVHIGMPNHDTALRVYNHLVQYCEDLCRSGDKSQGRRLEIYQKVAPERNPPMYEDWPAFFNVAQTKGFANNPRDCWTLIRISTHGTIEFRMFGSTNSLGQIEEWATMCHTLCIGAA
jgi:gamma-glutamyl:cysteine ligase YbdK (ATP-grasp superfamily)